MSRTCFHSGGRCTVVVFTVCALFSMREYALAQNSDTKTCTGEATSVASGATGISSTSKIPGEPRNTTSGSAQKALLPEQRTSGDAEPRSEIGDRSADQASRRAALENKIAACTRIIQSNAADQLKLLLAYFHRGEGYTEKRQYDAAISDFDDALRLNPEMAAAYKMRGHAAWRAGQYAAALDDLGNALSVNQKKFGPNDSDVANSLDDLADLNMFLGRYTDAEPLLERAIAIRGDVDDLHNARSLSNLVDLPSTGAFCRCRTAWRAGPCHRRELVWCAGCRWRVYCGQR